MWILALTSFFYIGLRAFQQLNVTHGRYLWVPPATASMAVMEILSVVTLVKSDSLWAAVPMTLGGVLGCWLAMYANSRIKERK